MEAGGAAPPARELAPTVVILPGFLTGSRAYTGMATHFKERGYRVYVVPIKVSDWYGSLVGSSFTFYLERAEAVVREAFLAGGCRRVHIAGHSAGGWLARLLLGEEPYEGRVYGLHTLVESLVSLGSPHLSLEAYPVGHVPERRWGYERVDDMPPAARISSLQFANHFYPGSFLADAHGVRCLAVCGRCHMGGGPDGAGEPAGQLAMLWRLATDAQARREAVAYGSYVANCGRGDVEGDGVTPLESALPPGWEHQVLDGVGHTAAVTHDALWYGSPQVVDAWAAFLPQPAWRGAARRLAS